MKMPEVTIIDYGVGNLLSVKRSLEHCGAKVFLSADPNVILTSQRVVLPGVGAFPNAMDALNKLKLVSVIKELDHLGMPLLAICLGMQLLMDESEEFGFSPGLGLIPGRVVAVPNVTAEGLSQKIPHIGWSSLYHSYEPHNWSGTLLENNQVGDPFYFVHSYMAQPVNPENGLAHAIYGGHKVSAVISKGAITGCQFHPEKSGEVGLKILRKFCLD